MSEQFEGFDSPGTTATPDYVFDFLLKELTGNELKVLMYIIRRTFGFGKSADAISLSQFREGIKTKDGKVLNVGCGIGHNRLILAALAGLEKKGYVVSQKREGTDGGKETTIYKLRFKKDEQVVTPSNEVVTSGNQGGSYFMPRGVVTSGNIQETHVEQETLDECVVSPTLEQPEITHTFSTAELIAMLAERGVTIPSESVSPDYTTSPTIDAELSTASKQNVDNSQDENGSHPQQSYSHRQDTNPATNVGKMGVLEVPITQGIDEVVAPSQVKPQTPDKPTTPLREDLDERKRLGKMTETIKRLAHIDYVSLPALKFLDAWGKSVYGPCSLNTWEVSSAIAIVEQMEGTIEDALLIARALKIRGVTVKVEAVYNSWSLLKDLKKVKPTVPKRETRIDDTPYVQKFIKPSDSNSRRRAQ